MNRLTIILLLVLICPQLFTFSSAQVYGQTISYLANAPRGGDAIKKKVVEYFEPGNSGNNIVWDFRDVEPTRATELTEYFIGLDSLLWGTNSASICRFRLNSDSLQLLSYETPYQRIDYTQPITLLTYPYAYGYTMSNNYEGTGLYCQKHVVKNRGTMIAEIDGTGSIITIDSDTLLNVVRLHSIRTSSVCMYSQSDTLYEDSTNIKQEIQETNQWYVRGYRYPLYETSSISYYDNLEQVSCIQKAYVYSPDEQFMPEDPENKKILEKIQKEKDGERTIIHYTVSNNGSVLQVSYTLDSDASINSIVCNNLGMVYGRQVANQHAGSGYQLSFDISSLPRGEYVLYINVNGKVYNEKFEKKL